MSEKSISIDTATADSQSAPSGRRGAPPARLAGAKSASRARNVLYLASWGALALAAGAYLAAVIVKPRFLAEWLPAMDRVLTQPQGNDQNRSAVIAEAQQLRANLEQSQAEVSRLRQELGSRDARVKSAELRIAGLERDLQAARGPGGSPPTQPHETGTSASNEAPLTGSQHDSDATRRALAGAIGAPTEGTRTDSRAGAAPRSFEIVNGAPTIVESGGAATYASAKPGADVEMPLPERRPAVAARPKTTPIAQIVRPTIAVSPPTTGGIETGSVGGQTKIGEIASAEKPSQPITFGAPVVTRSANPVGIRLTAGPSVDALRLSWSLMSERYAYELNGLQARYVSGNTAAAPFALVAGPIADEHEAERRCALLIARGIPCSVDSFVGNAL